MRNLSGCGLEIGALHHPLAVPGVQVVDYLDLEDGTQRDCRSSLRTRRNFTSVISSLTGTNTASTGMPA